MEDKPTLFLDTNALLDLGDKAFSEFFIISQKTLEEIEDIKTSSKKDQEVKYKARNIARLLDTNEDKYLVLSHTTEINELVLSKNLSVEKTDNIIIGSAYWYNITNNKDIIVVTNDLNCKHISSKVFGLLTKSVDELDLVKDDGIYKGYKHISGNTEYINNYMFDCLEKDTWYVNEYLIIENTDDNSIKEMRFDGNKFVSLKLPPSKYIKGKNSLQRCALDALLNPDITIVAVNGSYGSGKSYLSMQMALYHIREKGTHSKILGVREPWGEGKEVGFLKGDFEQKTDLFFKPLEQQLNGGEFELESLKHQGVLESIIPYFMKGTTYQDTIIVCDEAEDLSEKQIKLVGTRLGENSKVFFSGDYKQSLLNQTRNNSIVKMCNELKGNKKFACIYLGEDVRSETSKLFADLFEG